MNRQTAAISILALTACPQNDAPPADGADEIEATTVDGPDLPGDSTESDSDTATTMGDGDPTDSESTEDSDGSTSEESTGDDDVDSSTDTDGETGSEAVPTSLIVESGGQRIGYLMFVTDYGMLVWDDVNGVTFNVNQLTGHVVDSSSSYFYTTPNCTGTRYYHAQVPVEICNQAAAPPRRGVSAEAPLSGGFAAPTGLIASTGEPLLVNIQSFDSGPNCAAIVNQFCMFAYAETDVIPMTFALPITVAETEAMP